MKLTSPVIQTCCAALFVMGVGAPMVARGEVVFHADFDLDTVGEEPSRNPPGDPQGDAFGFSTQGGPITVADEVGDLVDQPLLMRRRTGFGASFHFTALPVEHPPCARYEASWRSLLRSEPQMFGFAFYAHSTPNSPARPLLASVQYRPQGVLTYNSSSFELPVYYYTDVAQLFELTLDMVGQTSSLSIDGVAIEGAQDVRFSQRASTNLRHFSGSPGLIDLYDIAVDDIHIECVPEPAAALGGLVALMTLGWLGAKRGSKLRRHHPLSLVAASAWALLLIGPRPAPAESTEPSYGVALSASIFATFEASPTLNLANPDLFGGSNGVLATGLLEESSSGASFREIYQGVGESGTSLFEADYHGVASLGDDTLRVEILAVDHNNASASYWSLSGSAGTYEALSFSGPTDTSGNYVIDFTTDLDAFTVSNTQPPGFDSIWRANASTRLTAEPLDASFRALGLETGATLLKACPTLTPCFGYGRHLTQSGSVTVPGSNPVLFVSHSLGVTGRSSDAEARGSLEMNLPSGVTFTYYEAVPEPGAAGLTLAALGSLACLRSMRDPGSGLAGRTRP